MTADAPRRAPERPPAAAEALLALLLPREDHGPIIGDLAEEFAARVRAHGVRSARTWYRRQVLRSSLPALKRRLRRVRIDRVRDLMSSIGTLWLDAKLGLRALVKYPGLTVVAVLALAFGIPAGIAPIHLATAWEAPPPLEAGERLQVLRNVDAELGIVRPTALYDFARWRDGLTSYAAIGVAIDGVYNVGTADRVIAPVEGAEVTSAVFEILGVAPLLGRTLTSADDDITAPDVVVLGHDLWQVRFMGSRDVIGGVIDVGGVPRTIVGVMPEDFRYPWSDQIWIPLRERAFVDDHGGARMLRVIARLKEGVTPDEAQVELDALDRRMAAELPDNHEKLRAEVVPFSAGITRTPKGGLRAIPQFYAVQVFTVLMLLFPSINIGMLVLARTAARSNELAVRMALGAGRMRIVTQLFVESAVLAILACSLGFLALHTISLLSPASTDNNWIDLGLTVQTLALGFGLACLSAAVVGVVPALKVTGSARIHGRIQQGAATASSVRFGWMSTSLIVLDVALVVAILGVSVGIWGDDPRDGLGIPTDQYLSAELMIPRVEAGADRGRMSRTESARLVAAQEAFVRRVGAEPGVGRVAVASVLPGMDHSDSWFEVDGDGSRHELLTARIDIGYFDALAQPILVGRGFGPSDIGENRSTVIVNTSFVEAVLEGRSPIGMRVRRWTRGDNDNPWFEIIGVVGNLGMFASKPESDAGIYFPLAPGEIYPVPFAIHVGDDPVAFTPRLRELAREADPNAIIWEPTALSEVPNFYLFIETRLRSVLLVLTAILLVISTMAVYALMSFTVAQRRRELGIRIALGAGWRDVVATIARHAAVQLGVGSLAGMGLSWVLLRLLEAQLGQTSMESPVLIAGLVTVGVVGFIGAAACVAPARRALKIAPTETLAEG